MAFDVLAGMRVLDFTRVLAGPLATRLLADFGAEVIKVQSEITESAGANDQPYFLAWNRNKKSISLDMSRPGAREIVLELVGKCDVVTENFSPRVFSNWGLEYETLRQVNPKVIVLRMSAAGQTGPWRDSVAFGPTIHALSGLTHLTAYPGGHPLGPGFAHADVVSGVYGALAVAAAILFRNRTGEGQCIDLSEYEAMASLLGPSLLAVSRGEGRDLEGPQAHEARQAAPYGCFRCMGNDRWCAIAVFDDAQWVSLCEVLDLEEASRQPEFSSLFQRRKHCEDLRRLIEERTSRRCASQLAQHLQQAGVPAAPVYDAKDLAEDPHLVERGFFLRCERPARGEWMGDRGGFVLGDEQSSNWRPAPALGQDNDDVFVKLLGWSPERLAELRRAGVIG